MKDELKMVGAIREHALLKAAELAVLGKTLSGLPKIPAVKMPNVDLALSPILRLAQNAALPSAMTEAGLELGHITRHLKLLQMPIAVNAFSASLGIAERIGKSAFWIPKFDLPNIIPGIDWDALHERDERVLRYAAQNNWFIQPETSYTMTGEIHECGDNLSKMDALFMEVTKELKEAIRERLIRDHPKHAPMIREMFMLHDEGRYLASIPLAMACAEGIAYVVTETSIFNTDKNRPAVAAWLEKRDLSRLAKAFLSSLTEQHPMSKPRPGKLNRHRVLHGMDTEYGKEIFSYQAISLLGFVGWAFATDGLIHSK